MAHLPLRTASETQLKPPSTHILMRMCETSFQVTQLPRRVMVLRRVVTYLKSQHQKLHLVQKCKTSQQSNCPSKDNPGHEKLENGIGCCKTLNAAVLNGPGQGVSGNSRTHRPLVPCRHLFLQVKSCRHHKELKVPHVPG